MISVEQKLERCVSGCTGSRGPSLDTHICTTAAGEVSEEHIRSQLDDLEFIKVEYASRLVEVGGFELGAQAKEK